MPRLDEAEGAANNARRNANDKGEQRYQQCGADTYLGHSDSIGSRLPHPGRSNLISFSCACLGGYCFCMRVDRAIALLDPR